ncbi:antibiotic biosynthesis monooxygenase family protein [Streptomyces wuyuanensis]|uniref:antibiotic biosynthesis monooxygenase family protein n=1 Tax=Streptomyces wuyuanensis TaxID=1196353 RepID=UPI0034304FD5
MSNSSRIRVVLRVQLHEGMGAKYASAYNLVRDDIAKADGYISSQLCQSVAEPDTWILTSEWASPGDYQAFVEDEGFTARRASMRACVRDGKSSQYAVVSE